MATEKQLKHLKKIADNRRGTSLSKCHRERIIQSFKIKRESLPIQEKNCEHCGKTFGRSKYPNGVYEPYPRFTNRKYCSLYCARHCKDVYKKFKTKGGIGNNNPNWKGGRNKRQDGYIEVYNPVHPFSNKDGYVMEHRIVMERLIGRFLSPKEVIHHINQKKDDNRIENLRLFENTGFHLNHHLGKIK